MTMTQAALPKLSIERRNQERVLRGHPWIFANQVQGDIKRFEPGELVEVANSNGNFLGLGYVNPHSLIAVRILTRQREEIGKEFLRRRLEQALAYRERFLPGSLAHRWVFSEADGLPGLVIDRYGEYLSVQLLTLGMEKLGTMLREALLDVFPARAIVLRNDASVRRLEDLPLETALWHGELEGMVEISEGDARFHVDLTGGQKTGFYYDQRENRAFLAGLHPAGKVLDCFCYTGAWGIQAARATPGLEVLGVDESKGAVELARANAERNGVDALVAFEQADAFDALEALGEEKRRFDCVVLDPPAMVKSRAKIMEGWRGYRRLHRLAGRVVKKGGLLATSCCSYLMSAEKFQEAVADGLARAGRSGRVVHVGQQARDHPFHPAVPESQYLKFLLIAVN